MCPPRRDGACHVARRAVRSSGAPSCRRAARPLGAGPACVLRRRRDRDGTRRCCAELAGRIDGQGVVRVLALHNQSLSAAKSS